MHNSLKLTLPREFVPFIYLSCLLSSSILSLVSLSILMLENFGMVELRCAFPNVNLDGGGLHASDSGY